VNLPATASSRRSAWVHGIRVPTLPAALTPVIVGSAVAARHHSLHPLILAATLAAAVLIQVGTNLANDYYDFAKGADTAQRIGPPRIAASGAARPSTVLLAALATFAAAAAIGAYLMVVGGLPILLIGLASIAAGLAYTAGPVPLGYRGLGEITCFVFFGPVAVMGTDYLQTGHAHLDALLASLPVALLVTAILVVNNIRDIDTDRRAGKRTLAVRLGRRGARVLYDVLLLGPYVFPFCLALTGGIRWWIVWLPLLTLPLSVRLISVVARTEEGPPLNAALRGTARLHLAFGIILAAAILI